MSDKEKEDRLHLEDWIQIQIADDKMTASILCIEENAVRSIREEDLVLWLKECGVTDGLLIEPIRTFLKSPYQYMDQEQVIAKGIPPIEGQDSYVEIMYQKQPSKRPKKLEDGSVDFHTVTEILNIKKGQLIAKRIPSTEGVDGRTVTGEEVKAKAGRDVPIQQGKNIVIDPKSQAVYALIDGQVSITENERINVLPVFQVDGDLDFEIGNIDFVGNVLINGNVPTGFKIKAEGDIHIFGGVEGAELEAKGSVEIRSGITAQSKGSIQAGRNIRASFIIHGNVTAQKNIYVRQSIMHSQVSAGESIECLGGKGLIVGGIIQAGKKVECRTLGNTLNTYTSIVMGVNSQATQQLQEIDRELDQHRSSLTKSKQALELLNQLKQNGELSLSKQGLYAKLIQTQKENEQKIDHLHQKYEELSKPEIESAPPRIEVTGTVFPGTQLTFGKYTKHMKQELNNIIFVQKNNEIVGVHR